MATKTFTLASANMVYTDRHNINHTITTDETFQMDMTDLGTSASYGGLTSGSTMELESGEKIVLEGDSTFTFMLDEAANATAQLDAGSLWFTETDGYKAEWHIRSVTLDDADDPSTAIFELERVDAPIYSVDWTGITVA